MSFFLFVFIPGSNIACGCHAAVYELRLRTTNECCDKAASTSSIDQQQHIMLNEHTKDPLIVSGYPFTNFFSRVAISSLFFLGKFTGKPF